MGFHTRSSSFQFRLGLVLIHTVLLLVFFAIDALACEITQITPNNGQVGQTLQINVNGIGFGFIEFGVVDIDFGPGTQAEILNFLPVTVEPMPETLLVSLSVDPGAVPGPRTVTVFGEGGKSCAAEGAFSVTQGVQENQPPVGEFEFFPEDPTVGEDVTFDASDSFDPDGQIVQYLWDFGDGATGEGSITGHLYAAPGTYSITLTVVDDNDLESNVSREIRIVDEDLSQEPLGIAVNRVIWNGHESNIGEVEIFIPASDRQKIEFINVFADFNQDGTFSDYSTGSGIQPEWIVRNLPLPVHQDQMTLASSFPFVDDALFLIRGEYDIGWSVLEVPSSEIPPVPGVDGVIRAGPINQVPRVVVSPGAGGPTPASITPDEVAFALSIWNLLPIDLVFHAGMPDINQRENECVPTATANSLRWLAKAQGFNDKLPPTNDKLVNDLVEAMNTSAATGTQLKDFFEGKKKYIKDKGLPLVVEGQDGFFGIEGLTQTKPTVEFLIEQLKKGQDVEIDLGWITGDKRNGGHFLTVVGIARVGNKTRIYVNDPDDGKQKTQVFELEARTKDPFKGFLQLKGYGKDHFVDLVVAESPAAPKCIPKLPTAVITPEKMQTTKGHSFPFPVVFDGTKSHDNDACGTPPEINKYEWTVIDPPTLFPNPEVPAVQPLSGTGPTFTTTFNAPGTYTVMLTVTDNDGQQDVELVDVEIGNRKPWIKITDRRVELTPSGQVRRWVIRFKTKDPDLPDKNLQKNIDVSYQDVNGTHQLSGGPPLHVDFAGGWAIVSAEISATDPHKAKGVLNDIVMLWRSGSARQQLQQHLRGGGATAFLKAQLQKILKTQKGQDWIDKNPTKADNLVNKALNRIVNMQLRNTFRKVIVPNSAASTTVVPLQVEEVWEGMYQEGSELLGIVPTVVFDHSPSQPETGQTVRFDASASSPSEDGTQIDTYEWDFDGDGKTDATGPSATFQFDTPGDHDVVLRVVDDQGAEATVVQTVTVEGTGLSVEQALDANSNGFLDDDEIKSAIQLWILGGVVPGTGQTIDDAKMLELIRKWVSGERLNGTSDAGQPAALRLAAVGVRPTAGGFSLVVEGQGVSKTRLEVFDLAGRRLLNHTSDGPGLRFVPTTADGRRWANGVYLYVVTTYGAQGQVQRSAVRKLVVLH